MSNLGQIGICRTYRCDNEKCEAEIVCQETIADRWLVKCPFCGQKTLFLKSATSNMSIMMDPSKPKTLGSLGEQNGKRLAKEGKMQKEEEVKPPFWRKNKKINYNILKDPKTYVSTGKVY